MGFKLPIRTARLVFDGDYQGLEVKVRLNIPLKTYLAIQDLLAENKLLELIQEFARSALLEWNVEAIDGKILPATPEGMLEVDPAMAARIVQEWQAAIVNPPAPFVAPPKNGGMSAELLNQTAAV